MKPLQTVVFVVGRIAIAGFLAMAAISVPAISEELDPNSTSLNCDTGPVMKTYGMTQWLVYSCDDHRSAVIVAAPENPAAPSVFMFFPGESGYQLRGEGTGDREVTAAAFEDLKALSEQDIAGLIEQTNLH